MSFGEEGNIKNLSIVPNSNEIFFGKRIVAIKKVVRRKPEVVPSDIGVRDNETYIEWQEVVMKRAIPCMVIGERTVDNGVIVPGMTDPIKTASYFKPTHSVRCLLVVQNMRTNPFLIPYPKA